MPNFHSPHIILLAAGMSRRLNPLTHSTPKALLPLREGETVMARNLKTLESFGLKDVICVVGYRKELFYEQIGDRFGTLNIRYVESPDYETTGSARSIGLAQKEWERHKRPALIIHADLFYHPEILSRALRSSAENTFAIDNRFGVKTHDEVHTYGSRKGITSVVHPYFRKPDNSRKDLLGEMIGMNKHSPAFLDEFFPFLERHLAEKGRNQGWEPVLDAFLPVTRHPVVPIFSDALPWVNINYEEDLKEAQRLHREVFGSEEEAA